MKGKPDKIRAIVTAGLLALSVCADAAPTTPYYLDSFNPEQRPWAPGHGMNIEEVFKNYQYYQVVPDDDGRKITVHHYIRGDRVDSQTYSIQPDGSLQKTP